MSKKIVFINQDSGYLMVDIINAFASKYDKIALIAGRVRPQHVFLDSKVEWSKIIRYSRDNLWGKFFSWLSGTIHIVFLLLFKFNQYDIFYVNVPPISYFPSYFLKNKFSVLIFDVYPDALQIINIKQNSPIYLLWSYINKKVFAKARIIFTLNNSMKRLLSKYVQEEKIITIPYWSSDSFKPLEKKDNRFVLANNLSDKFVILLTGNLGHSHNLDLVIKVANRLMDYDDIVFVIAVRGPKAAKIREKVLVNNLKNIKMVPFQKGTMVPMLFSAADIGLICLDEKAGLVSMPSRIYNFLAVGAPLLGIAPKTSEVNKLVLKFKNGKCFNKLDIESMENFIRNLKSDKELVIKYRSNSLEASKNYTSKNAKLYLDHYE